MTAWLAHMSPALLIITAIAVSWFGCWITDRANGRRDAAHAAELAAARTSLGTLLPGPSETPVGDLAAKVVGL